MIVSFSVQNFRSFKDKAEFSMIAEPLKTKQDSELSFSRYDLLLTAGIFGANASGKSNIVKALSFVQGVVTKSNAVSAPATQHPLLVPYLLNTETRGMPSVFELILWDQMHEVEYIYHLEISREEIVKESLEIADKKNKNFTSTPVFSRQKQKFNINKPFRKSLDILKDKVLPQALAVNVFAQFADANSLRFVELVDKILIVDGSNDTTQLSLEKLYNDAEFRHKVEKFIKSSDISISELSVQKVEIDDKSLQRLPFEIKFSGKASSKNLYQYQIHTTHKAQDADQLVLFDILDHESMGTQRLLGLAALMFRVVEEGSCLIIDEFGSSMHSLINKEIIELFNTKNTNPRGAQLIFSTHDTFILSDYVDLRRDQIWFVEKDNNEESKITGLSEYKVRPDMRIEKNYLEGRFGAVPITTFEDETE